MVSKLILPAFLLGVGGAVAAAAAPSHVVVNGQTLVLRVHLTKQARRPPKGNSAGALFVDRLSVKHNGKPDGYGHEACVVTFPVSKTRLQLQCDEFLALADGGDITAQGVDDLDFSNGGPQPTTFAITGGTGPYDSVRGEIMTKPMAHYEVWTLHLLP